jgi:hypothetical protein
VNSQLPAEPTLTLGENLQYLLKRRNMPQNQLVHDHEDNCEPRANNTENGWCFVLHTRSLITATAAQLAQQRDAGEVVPVSIASRPALGPTQPPIKWVQEDIPPWGGGQGHEAEHTSQSSVEVKNGGDIPPIPPYVFMAK